MGEAATTARTPWAGRRERLAAYKELGKLYVYDQYLGVPIAWSLMDRHVAFAPRTGLLLMLLLVGGIGIVTAAVALDDVSGFRDGIDDVTYGAEGAAAGRKRSRKPLLDGRLTVEEATAYARVAGIFGAASVAAAFAVAGFRPLWLSIGTPIFLLAAINYSWGLKLSYLGGGEAVLTFGTSSTVVVPYSLVTGRLPGAVALESLVFGLWMLSVVVFSNTHDAEGDRGAGRLTVPSRFSVRANRVFIGAVFCAGWGLFTGGVLSGILSAWLLVALVPFLALQAVELHVGLVRKDPLRARWCGFRAYRVGVLTLVLTNAALAWS